ncbi:hypothetical protein [Chitinophaga sp. YIM B06452]|uniref:hypothetical protein n=1 Tax=Chitinophaga sp. YIM B06452 TaxID=3082158 RepID=UPI0031FEA594
MIPETPIPAGNRKSLWLSAAITALIAGLLSWLLIYVMDDYGIALFFLTPVFIGYFSTVFYGRSRQITRKQAVGAGLLSLAIFSVGLLAFAMEGLICIAMAAPLVIPVTCVSSLIGFAVLNRKHNNNWIILLLAGSIPATAFIESSNRPPLRAVVTSIEINASAQAVWEQVIEFPVLKEPEEFIFKTGIAYPVNAKIEGAGIGAVRHCNFTTGSFVEPITVWDEPRLLKFDVAEQPAPLKELSFWDVNAPHLHDYFVSREGQFKLVELPNGHTLLEGTTWYYHDIKPAFYWRIWSDYIIHKIHRRVLEHIKTNAENAQ